MCLGALSSVPSQRRSTSKLAIVDALHLTTMRKHRQAQLGADLAKQSNAVGTLLLQRGPSTSLLWISIRHTPPCHPHSGCSSGLRTPFAFKRVSFFRAVTGKLRIPARHVPATCSRAPCMPCGWRRKRGDHPCWRSNGTRRSDGRPHGLSCWRLRLRRVCAGDVVAGCARMRASKLRRGGGRGGFALFKKRVWRCGFWESRHALAYRGRPTSAVRLFSWDPTPVTSLRRCVVLHALFWPAALRRKDSSAPRAVRYGQFALSRSSTILCL